jgi:hypothetical protein
MSDESRTLEDHLGDEDWAIIIGKDGNLKGLFMPDGTDEELVPESIVTIMADYFGVNFDEEMNDEETSDGQTIH